MLHCQRATKKRQHTGFSSIFQNNRKKNSTPGLADFDSCQASKWKHKVHSAERKKNNNKKSWYTAQRFKCNFEFSNL